MAGNAAMRVATDRTTANAAILIGSAGAQFATSLTPTVSRGSATRANGAREICAESLLKAGRNNFHRATGIVQKFFAIQEQCDESMGSPV